MMFASATNFYRKSGVAEWRDLRFSRSVHKKTGFNLTLLNFETFTGIGPQERASF